MLFEPLFIKRSTLEERRERTRRERLPAAAPFLSNAFVLFHHVPYFNPALKHVCQNPTPPVLEVRSDGDEEAQEL